MHFDNAQPHKSAGAQEAFEACPFQAGQNQPCIPGTSPLNFGVYGTVKNPMLIEKIESNKELKKMITSILNDLGKYLIKKVFSAWGRRSQEGIDTDRIHLP